MRLLLFALACILPILGATSLHAQEESTERSDEFLQHFISLAAENAPFDSLEAVFDAWSKLDDKELLPYVVLANQYIVRDTNRARARQLTTRALAIMLEGAFEDTESTIPASPYAKYLYYFTAILDYHEGIYPSALINIHKALYLSGNDIQSSFYYRMGQIYAAMDSSTQAERAYFYGYTGGETEAGDSLKALFARNGSDYTVRMRELSEQEFEEAPEFTGRTLAGREITLSDYRGKVVVLNFWFIGCGGCVIEEEALARLTNEYDTSEVVLIGLARDEGANVTKYFNGEILKGKGHEYYHMQIPAATEAIAKYNVRGFPTHVIIDRYGRITSKTSGGSSQSDDMLRPVIEAARGY